MTTTDLPTGGRARVLGAALGVGLLALPGYAYGLLSLPTTPTASA